MKKPDRPVELSDDPSHLGLTCPKCGCRHWNTLKTWPGPGGVRRTRECRHCGHRKSTLEK